MKILITGHKGFIGQNLRLALLNDHELFGYEWDSELLPDVKGFDWVIHLGAISDTTERDVDKIISQNYEFSKWLYNECNRKDVNFQYASSASVYGTSENFNEDAPKNPQSPYAWSKYLFDRWLWNLPYHKIIVQGFRYFNVYGPYEEHKENQASPITKFTKQAKETGKIQLFEDSDQYLRDFVFVGDICKAHIQLLSSQESGLFNIGSGNTTSFQEIAEIIAKKENATIEYIPMPKILEGQYQKYTCADITKLKNLIKIDFTTVEDYINGL